MSGFCGTGHCGFEGGGPEHRSFGASASDDLKERPHEDADYGAAEGVGSPRA